MSERRGCRRRGVACCPTVRHLEIAVSRFRSEPVSSDDSLHRQGAPAAPGGPLLHANVCPIATDDSESVQIMLTHLQPGRLHAVIVDARQGLQPG